MAEEKKLWFLMRGIKQKLLVGLVRNPPNTVSKFITEAVTIEKALEMRTTRYNRHASFNCADAFSTDDLRETIRAIVREELRKLLPSMQPQGNSIADLV